MGGDSGKETSKPRVAVVIPCFEDGAFVAEALDSIRESEPIEAIVVDDGSPGTATRAAVERLERSGVKVIRHRDNLGVSETRMTGLRNTTAPYVLPLDSDDLLFPGVLSLMADRLDADRGAAVCYGDYLEFGDGGIDHFVVRLVPEIIDPYRLAYTNEYPPSALFRRETLERLGGWRRVSHQLDARSDWSLWMTLAEYGERGLHMDPATLVYMRRIHPNRLAWIGRRHHPDIYRALRKRHTLLFGNLKEHRRESDLGQFRKFLYPILYGRRALRPKYLEPKVKAVLDRTGIWTMQRPVGEDERRRLVAAVRAARGLD
jgi:glycosyltransferase involved in cell wall biosynthesis